MHRIMCSSFRRKVSNSYLARENVTRIEKIQHISQHETGRKRLHVCCDETENCGKCGKCFRTLLILELIGKQPEFKESFKDTSAYEKKGWKKYVWILDKKIRIFSQRIFMNI
mgnify:CR=1 FL=1